MICRLKERPGDRRKRRRPAEILKKGVDGDNNAWKRHTNYPALVTFLRVSCEDPQISGRRTFGPYAQLGGTKRPLANCAVHRVGPV
jgi:hypothetical protein